MKELAPLAVAFTVLAALVAWREATSSSSRGIVEEAGLKPLAVREFTPDDAARIEVAAPGATAAAFTLEKKDKSWRVTSTFAAPASGGNVTKLLDALAKAEGEFRSDDKAALEQFDLSPAKAVGVKVLDKDGKPLAHLAIGRTSGQHGAFVRNLAEADDPRAYSLTADVRGLLGLSRTSVGEREADKPDAGYFHDKEFPQSKVTTAKHVELVAPGRVAAFDLAKKDEKDKTGEWTVSAGGPGVAVKKDGLERAVAALGGGLHPMALVDPAKKDELGFGAPKYRIAVTLDDGTTRAAVGTTDAASEHFYVRLDAALDPDVVYEASEYEFHQMFPQGQVLFDLPKLDVPKAGVVFLVLNRGNLNDHDLVGISRKGSKPSDDWEVQSPKWPLAPKQSALRALAGALSSVRAIDYVDETGFGAPDFSIEFEGTVAPSPAPGNGGPKLFIGPKAPSGKGRLAGFASASGHTFVIDDATVERLTPQTLSLFETKVLHGWKREDVTALRVASGVAIVRDGDGWSIEDADGAKTKAVTSAVEKWLERWLAVSVTGNLAGVADFESTPVTIERTDGAPIAAGVSVTKDGKRVLVLGADIFTVDDKDDLLPDRAALEEKTAPKDGEKK